MKVTVTFEFPLRAPLTARLGDLGTENPGVAARMALNQAKALLKPREWSSAVILLERPMRAPKPGE